MFASVGLMLAVLGAPVGGEARARLDPGIGTRAPVSALSRDLASRGLVALHVYTAGADGAERVARGAPALVGAEVLGTYREGRGGLVVLAARAGDAARIASMAGVVWVEQSPEPTTRNDTVRLIVQTGGTVSAPFDAAGLTGAGQIVGVLDQPLDWDHCAFDDPGQAIGPGHRKIVAYNTAFGGVHAHGTHVCGILAGDWAGTPNLRGVATGARLAFHTIPTLEGEPLRSRLELHASQGAAIHSNSWGDDQSAVYGGLARAVDAFCWEHDENLVVFAVSNGSALKTPENAKNALAVAATQDAPMQHRMCVGAPGPTADGRRKPDLVAPGCSVFSAYPFGAGCPTVFSSGTSMATPAVSGAAAIARQYFMEGWHHTGSANPGEGFVPSGALLKAVLVAGASDVIDEPGWPSARQGWGRVNLGGSLPLAGSGRRLLVRQGWNNGEGALGAGGGVAVRFEVVGGGQPLRIALSWHDAPGEFGASDPVVNDLDLVLETPWGEALLGNAIDPATGASVAGGTPDRRNTVEVIALPSAPAGEYRVRVEAGAVRVGTQGYGLVINGAVSWVASSCGAADLSEPFGVLDLSDIGAFTAGFVAGSPVSDLTGDGVLDLADINAFVQAFAAGCP